MWTTMHPCRNARPESRSHAGRGPHEAVPAMRQPFLRRTIPIATSAPPSRATDAGSGTAVATDVAENETLVFCGPWDRKNCPGVGV